MTKYATNVYDPKMPDEKTLADFFAELCDLLRKNEVAFEDILDQQERQREAVLTLAEKVDAVIAADYSKAYAALSGLVADGADWLPGGEFQRIVLVAQAIDRWYAPLSATVPPTDIAHVQAMRLLRKSGGLNTDRSRGSVLLKRPLWGRWRDPNLELPTAKPSVWDAFTSLVVMPSVIPATDPDDPERPRNVTFSYRILDSVDMRAVEADWVPLVGFVPLATDSSDIDVQLTEEDARHWYDAQAKDLGIHAQEAVAALCAAGVHIIVFPEMAIHPDALTSIQTAIAEHGPGSKLLLVLAGTSRQSNKQTRPFNEAVLFNHRGKEIGRQRKLHRWNLTSDLRNRYGLNPHGLPDSADLFEFITPGQEVLVLEQAQFGRVAIMICEDLGRSEPGSWLRDNVLLDWLFTPILDASIHPRRWMAQRGASAALGGRCRVVVANSFPLTHRHNAVATAGAGTPLSHCGIGLCIDVEAGQARYHLENAAISSPYALTRSVLWTPDRWNLFL